MSCTRTALAADAVEIFTAGLAAVAPAALVRRAITLEDRRLVIRGLGGEEASAPWPPAAGVWLVGAGKAAAATAAALEALLGDQVRGGLVVVKDGYAAPTARVEVAAAGHPTPDARSAAAAARMLALVGGLPADALVLALVSGGGSALLAAPAAGLSLEDKRRVTALLLGAGATIVELNRVRTALSAIKGGGLARAGRARMIGLVLSDVVDGGLGAVASGPTVPVAQDRAAARAVLERYDAWAAAPAAVRRHLAEPAAAPVAAPAVDNLLIGDNALCLAACAERARALGYRVELSPAPVIGEARAAGRTLGERARRAAADAPVCLVSGGETTVRVRGDGRGGRNLELALAAALALDGAAGVALLSAGTDGTDHVAEAAGALAYGDTLARARAAGLDAAASLRRNDAYPFFAALGDLVVTGPTATNVADVQLLLVGSARGGGEAP